MMSTIITSTFIVCKNSTQLLKSTTVVGIDMPMHTPICQWSYLWVISACQSSLGVDRYCQWVVSFFLFKPVISWAQCILSIIFCNGSICRYQLRRKGPSFERYMKIILNSALIIQESIMVNDSTIQTPVPTLVLGPQVKHPKSTSTCQNSTTS